VKPTTFISCVAITILSFLPLLSAQPFDSRVGRTYWALDTVAISKQPTISSPDYHINRFQKFRISARVPAKDSDQQSAEKLYNTDYYVVEFPWGRDYIRVKDFEPLLMSGTISVKFPETLRRQKLAEYKKRGWPDRIAAAAADNKVVLGMTAEQAYASWGKPNKVNRTVTFAGVREQWVYDEDYLYFDDGVLTSMQLSR